MKIKMNQLTDFQKFYQNTKDAKIPLKTAYKLNKIALKVESELSFYQQKFGEIVSEFAKRDGQGNFVYTADGASIEIVDGRQVECQQRVEELQSLEIDMEDIKFSMEELEGLNLSIVELNYLMPFIQE